MRRQPLGPGEADGIVRARLGRPAQDLLEAAVVLEAWGGVPSEAALGLDAGILPRDAEPDPPGRRSAAAQEPGGRESIVAEGVALLMAIVAIAAWAGPLSDAFGVHVLQRALQISLPLTLGLQWILRSRYLSRRAGLRCLAEERVPVVLACAAIAGGLLALPGYGPPAAAFVATWVGGTVMARRGWGLVYAMFVVGEAVALQLGEPAARSLEALAGVVLLGVLLAVVTSRGASLEPPGRLARALAAGAIGALLGGVLVGDTSLGWGVHGAFPALALVPSVIGSFWGGYHLWQFHAEIPRGLRGVPLAQASLPIARGPAAGIVLGALVRLIGITALLSGLVLAAGHWTTGTDRFGLFVAFAAAALVCLFVSLHESLGYLRWAFLVAASSLAIELAVGRWVHLSVPGLGLIAGGTAGTLLALAPLVGRLRSPGRVLATALWIK
jgi:hypothetical protein